MLSKTRLAFIAAGVITGIPFTLAGLQLKAAMVAMEMVNCQQDTSSQVLSLNEGDLNSIRSGEFEKIGSEFRACNKNINPRTGVAEFLYDEHKRNVSNNNTLK